MKIDRKALARFADQKKLRLQGDVRLNRLFRPNTSAEIPATVPINPTAGSRIAEELNNHDTFLADYLATWRTQTQTKDPV